MTKQERLEYLTKEVAKHDYLYENDEPIISDTEYDKLYFELLDLEKELGPLPNSPTQQINTASKSFLKKVKHTYPLLSQEKSHTPEELRAFFKRVNDDCYLLQLKLDGLSVDLKYDSGRFIQAVTRGNGLIGEDITDAIKNVSNVPKMLPTPFTGEIRGEVIMNFEDFNRINSQIPNPEDKKSSPRNLAAGTVRSLDVTVVADRNIRVVVYDILGTTLDNRDVYGFLFDSGFDVVDTKFYTSTQLEELITDCVEFDKLHRSSLPFQIDGMVIKANSNVLIKKLGSTNKFPKSSIAFKFDSENRTTRLKDVIWQVGRTGLLTPVALLEPCEFDGAVIERASLANYSYIKDNDIRINDIVLVEKRNDVIPKVMNVVFSSRPDNTIEVTYPDICPICGAITSFALPTGEETPLLFCTNNVCDGQIMQKLNYFVSRDCMNIVNLSQRTIKVLLDQGYLSKGDSMFASIYHLKDYSDKIENLEGFGIRKVEILLKSIETSRNVQLYQFLASLSINGLGKSKAKLLAKRFETFEDIYKDKKLVETLENIDTFGPTLAKSIDEFLDLNIGWKIELIKELNIENEYWSDDIINDSASNIVGKSFVITGTLENPRKFYQDIIEKNGGTVTGSVSKKTTAVLIGSDAGSKETKAKSLVADGYPIILLDTEDKIKEFLEF